MSGIVAIGARERVQGFAFAGVSVVAADSAETARAAWTELSDRVELVILTTSTRAALDTEQLTRADAPLTVVMPE